MLFSYKGRKESYLNKHKKIHIKKIFRNKTTKYNVIVLSINSRNPMQSVAFTQSG